MRHWFDFWVMTPFNYFLGLRPTDAFEVTMWLYAWCFIIGVSIVIGGVIWSLIG